MPTLIVQRRIRSPLIATWKWAEDDCKQPLIFNFDDAEAYLYLEVEHEKQARTLIFNALFQLRFSSPSTKLIKGLSSSGKLSLEVAEKIYEYYRQVLEKFEGILRTAGNTKNLPTESPIAIEEFFEKEGLLQEGVMWWMDNESPKLFTPKIPRDRRRINPLFLSKQIITVDKWKKMQEAINNKDFPSEEMLELLRIRSRLEWREKKVATIEAAIIAETLLRDYAYKVLIELGMSKNKLKNIKDELTFNTILNILLPLSLSRSEAKRLKQHIQAVDVLRKIRNDVVHGNITESEIDEKNARKGIESTLKLLDFVKNRLS